MKWKELTKTLVILNWKNPFGFLVYKKNVSAIISLSWSCESRKGKITVILIDTLDSFEADTRKSVTGQSEGHIGVVKGGNHLQISKHIVHGVSQ